MAITAVSYGRMATLFPSAGSAYTYIDRGLNPHLGFLVGWAMLLDYLDQPILNGIYVALIIQRVASQRSLRRPRGSVPGASDLPQLA